MFVDGPPFFITRKMFTMAFCEILWFSYCTRGTRLLLRIFFSVGNMSLKPSVLRFKFEGFESLPIGDRDHVESDIVDDSHGYAWRLRLCPGGDSESEDGMIRLDLEIVGEKDVCVNFSFIIRDARGRVYYEEHRARNILFKAGEDIAWGCPDFIKRFEILDKTNNILLNGSLLIDVLIQVKPDLNSFHTPTSPLAKNMLKLLENEDDTDVTFKVKRTIIPAHKIVLKANASILFGFCEGSKKGTHIVIKDVIPKIFRIIIRYAYGGEIPGLDIILAGDNGEDIIDAADRYGIVGLKLAVERALVESLVIDSSTVAKWLIFADSKNCPLLKEQATAYFVSRSKDILNHESSKELKESPKLLTELMREIYETANIDSRFDNSGRNMSVDELRKKLDEKDLDVDGSKEMLVSRLEESNKRQRIE